MISATPTDEAPQRGHLIDGAFVDGGTTVENVSPSDTRDIIGHFARGDSHTVTAALDAAHHALPEWSTGPVQQRFDILDTVGSTIAARADELATLLAREEGKPVGEARGEVIRAAQLFKFFAGEAVRNSGELLESTRPGLTVEMTHEPVGVVGIITPWNFPMAIPAWKIAPALAYGNTVVVKPAEITPACTWEIASMLIDAGLPHGVLNLVLGTGHEVGQSMLDSGRLDAVTFTGSQAVGTGVMRAAAEQQMRVQCEMGGKNPMVVLGDADLDLAVEAVVNGAFYSTGQRCTSSSRVILTEDVHDEFVERLTNRLAALAVGHALDPNTVIGPVVSASQLEQNIRFLNGAREAGAEVIGGQRVHRSTDGYFLSPAIVLDENQELDISREEVFGPVVSLMKVADYDAALAMANDTEMGLSAGICSTSLSHVAHFKRHVRAGMVMVNAPTAGVDYHVSFGGRRGSTYGHREQGRAAREFFTQHKTAYVNAG